MNHVLEVALSNAIVVTGLAVIVYLMTRLVRNPALGHGLWVLVLVKLVTPPVVLVPLPAGWGLVRQPPGVESATRSDGAKSIPPVEVTASNMHLASLSDNSSVLGGTQANGLEPAALQTAIDGADLAGNAFAGRTWRTDTLWSVLVGVWLSGTVLVALTTGTRIYWFRRLLRLTLPAPADLQGDVQALAARIGIRHCPNVYLLPAAVGPMLWAVWGRPKILFPARLLAELGGDARRTILLHELSHLRRRDHWVRILEVVVTTLFWWHPVVWWARREIRPLEEACCDSFVISEMPDIRRTYATALVQSLRLLGQPYPVLPPAASGIGSFVSMKERVTMIMVGNHRRWISGPGRLVLGLTAAVWLPLLPAPSQGDRTLPEAETAIDTANPPLLRLYEGFDGKFDLDWHVVRPDPTHVSLTRNPGKLTITTQEGSIYRNLSPTARNLYLIRNPLTDGSDFVLTTCIDSFAPTMAYQQAGLLVYDDDDNYLKCDIEHGRSSVMCAFIRETDGEVINEVDRSDVAQERIWIRIVKRGKTYKRAYSTDGKEFVSAGARQWGNGVPKWIGILAKNAREEADDIDAAFDFFELRSLTPAEREDATSSEEEALNGTWGLASVSRNGKVVEDLPYLRIVFEGREMIVHEDKQFTRTRYTIDTTRQPKVMKSSSFFDAHGRSVSAAYRVEGNQLLLCYDPRPGSAAPSQLDTNPGDERLLFTLKRVPADMRFVKMDTDDDDQVSFNEFAEEYWYLSENNRTQGIFAAIDRDGDGRLSFQEFNHKSQEALFLMRDYDADKKLSLAEFTAAMKRQEQIAAAKEEFQRNDKDEDGFLIFKEIAYQSRDAEFWNADQNGDGALSFEEFQIGQPSHSSDEVEDTFRSIDTNGDGMVGLAEFQARSIVGKSAGPSKAS